MEWCGGPDLARGPCVWHLRFILFCHVGRHMCYELIVSRLNACFMLFDCSWIKNMHWIYIAVLKSTTFTSLKTIHRVWAIFILSVLSWNKRCHIISYRLDKATRRGVSVFLLFVLPLILLLHSEMPRNVPKWRSIKFHSKLSQRIMRKWDESFFCFGDRSCPQESCCEPTSREVNAGLVRSWKTWKSHGILKWSFPGLEKSWKKIKS